MQKKDYKLTINLKLPASELEYSLRNELEEAGWFEPEWLTEIGHSEDSLTDLFMRDSDFIRTSLESITNRIEQRIDLSDWTLDGDLIEAVTGIPDHWSNELNERLADYQERVNTEYQLQREMETELETTRAIRRLRELGYKITKPRKKI